MTVELWGDPGRCLFMEPRPKPMLGWAPCPKPGVVWVVSVSSAGVWPRRYCAAHARMATDGLVRLVRG